MAGYLVAVLVVLAALLLGVALVLKLWIRLTCLRHRTVTRAESAHHACAPRRIRVLSLNCFMRSWGVVDDCRGGDFKGERLALLVERVFPQYDVICLQEMFGVFSHRCRWMLRRARELGFEYHAVPEGPPLLSAQLMDNGLVVLSRLPIVGAVRTEVFADGVYFDRVASKGFQHARVALGGDGGRHVSVLNAHVQSDYRVHDPAATAVKRRQLLQLRRYIERHTADDDVVLCGDLNCNAIHWGAGLEPDDAVLNEAYGDMMRCLGLPHSADVVRELGADGRRPATSYCTYDRELREVDTVRREPHDAALAANGWVCLPRSVDYVVFRPSATLAPRLRPAEAAVLELPSEDPRFPFLSDHHAVRAVFDVVVG